MLPSIGIIGVELAQFCTAARLDGAPPEPWECPLDRCLAAADRFVLHGPFNELTPAAIDPMVLRVTETRYRQAIGKAQELRTPKLVLHAGFLPLFLFATSFFFRTAIFWVLIGGALVAFANSWLLRKVFKKNFGLD